MRDQIRTWCNSIFAKDDTWFKRTGSLEISTPYFEFWSSSILRNEDLIFTTGHNAAITKTFDKTFDKTALTVMICYWWFMSTAVIDTFRTFDRTHRGILGLSHICASGYCNHKDIRHHILLLLHINIYILHRHAY